MAFDYSKYSYDDLVAEITRLVSLQGEWVDTYQSSTGQVLIQLLAAMVDQLNYQLERRTQENFLPTARLASSVGALSNLLGYRPDRMISARGTLEITLTDQSGNPIQNVETITIPRYTRITQGDFEFVTAQEYIFLNSQIYPADINVIEGVKRTLTFDSSDTAGTLYNKNYVLIEDYQAIENSSFYISTPTQVFTDVAEPVGNQPPLGALAYAGPTDKVYDVRITNRGIQIVFGDGINGEKPVGIVTVEYIESSGPDVEITTTGLDFIFETSTIQDEDVPANDYYYILQNTTAIDGGFAAETVAETQRNAPDFIRTGNRAVTNSDYEFWAKQANIGGIIDAKAYGEQEKGISVSEANNVYLTYLTDDGLALSDTELTDFRSFMDVYKTTTTHLIVQEATIIPLQINAKLKRSSNLTAANSEVYDYVKTQISDHLALVEGNLGNPVYHSELVELLYNLTITKAGIERSIADYVTVTIKALYDLSIPYESKASIPVTFSAVTPGNDYVLKINGTSYTYTALGGDTTTDVARILASYVHYDLAVSASAVSNVITISVDSERKDNYILRSEEFENVYWVKSQAAVSNDLIPAPDGFSTADFLYEDTSNTVHTLSVGSLQAGEKIFSIRAKQGTRDHLELYFYNASNGERAATVFDLNLGTVVSGPGSITAGEDGWYTCEIFDDTSTVPDSVFIALYNAGRIYTGDGTSGIYIWGAQLNYSTAQTQYAKTVDAVVNIDAISDPYTISITGTTNNAEVSVQATFELPTYLLSNPDALNQILPGSVELITADGTVLFTDDGAGNFAGGTIDYTTGQIVIDIPETEQTYYVRYSQNSDSNFFTNPEQAFVYSLPKDNYTDTVEKLSTIVIEG